MSLLAQADKYRAKRTQRPPVPTPVEPVQPVTPTPQVSEQPTIHVPSTPEIPTTPKPEPKTVSVAPVAVEDSFECNGDVYYCSIQEGSESNEVFWNDLSQITNNKLICKVNPNHPFFAVYGRPNTAMLSVFKALSISKFKANISGGNITSMMNEFNAILKTLK